MTDNNDWFADFFGAASPEQQAANTAAFEASQAKALAAMGLTKGQRVTLDGAAYTVTNAEGEGLVRLAHADTGISAFELPVHVSNLGTNPMIDANRTAETIDTLARRWLAGVAAEARTNDELAQDLAVALAQHHAAEAAGRKPPRGLGGALTARLVAFQLTDGDITTQDLAAAIGRVRHG